ncbi:hypothetical protein BACCAP_01918 [Pseudoflavonifractor capillosus ATCC 29799]|uniref:Uncharacterized protein n=1 Tax=Pseudoflavonifractor capillosus ATCC 29799 TaxID=411467 RepID=A6NUN3_9FIRM|nr:hypothetical protein BACCAP_01918 [Pseudoflavonifractor capillosus ATCC 29799]
MAGKPLNIHLFSSVFPPAARSTPKRPQTLASLSFSKLHYTQLCRKMEPCPVCFVEMQTGSRLPAAPLLRF